MARLNSEYQDKYGYIFLICATGKTAVEMLTALNHRIENDHETEIQIAAGEQAKIIKLRLLKLISSPNSSKL